MKKSTSLKFFTSVLLLITNVFFSVAQEEYFNFNVEIPPSPTVGALGQYASHPIGYFNGLPEIDVPIYTIEHHGVQVPISLSYHASGIKVNQKESWVGLGWSLNAGGVIGRTVYGIPDDSPFGYLDSSTSIPQKEVVDTTYVDSQAMASTLGRFANGAADGEPDVFFYSFLGYTGEFIIKKDQSVLLMPHSELKIIPIFQGGGSNLHKFRIITPEGIEAVFGDDNWLNSKDYIEVTTIGGGDQYNSSWYLRELIIPGISEKIEFSYLTNDNGTGYQKVQDYTRVVAIAGPSGHPNFNAIYNKDYITVRPVYRRYLSLVKWADKAIEFTSSALRNNDRFLTDITVYNNYATLDQKIIAHFDLDYETITSTGGYWNLANYELATKRIYLKKLIRSSSSGASPTHEFSYINRNGLPSRTSFQYDDWGYFNGKSTNDSKSTSLPVQHYANGVDKDRDIAKMEYGTLESITFPTGGYIKFSYSAHPSLGGLRVTQQETGDGDQAQTIDYKYLNSLYPGYGIPKYTYSTTYIEIIYPETGPSYPVTYTIDLVQSKPFNVWTNKVYYTKIREDRGNAGAIDYEYYGANDLFNSTEEIPYMIGATDMGWARGKLKKKTTFKKVNNALIKVHELENQYDIPNLLCGFYNCPSLFSTIGNYNVLDYVFGLKVAHMEEGEHRWGFPRSMNTLYYYSYKVYYTQVLNLLSTTETAFSDTEDISTIKTYSYDSPKTPTLVTTIEADNSKGELLKTEFKYPLDFFPDGSTPNLANANMRALYYMKEQHRVNRPIEVSHTLTANGQTKIVDGAKTEYRLWPNAMGTPSAGDMYLPEKVFKYYDGSYKVVTVFDEYDSDNNKLLQYHVENSNVPTSYHWGYDSQYPVAKIENVSRSAIESNTTLKNKLDQLDDYTVIDSSNKAALQSVNQSIRSNLPNGAVITTYTYDPLIGMTSQSSPNGLTSFYGYDGLGRLETMRNHDFNLVKQYAYNYGNGSFGGNGTPAPFGTVSVSPTGSVTFDYLCVGSVSNWKTFTITNVGTGVAMVSLSLDGSEKDYFEIDHDNDGNTDNGGTIRLIPNETRTVRVRFVPSISDKVNANLKIEAGTIQYIDLNGEPNC